MFYWNATVARGSFIITVYQTVKKHFHNFTGSLYSSAQGQLYLLVTDQGFLTEEKVVWESLHNVDGDGNFCDSEFHLRPPSDPETVYRGQQDQIDQVLDFCLSIVFLCSLVIICSKYCLFLVICIYRCVLIKNDQKKIFRYLH